MVQCRTLYLRKQLVEIRKRRNAVKPGQIQIFVVDLRNPGSDKHPGEGPRRIEAGVQLPGVGHRELERRRRIETPLCRIRIDVLRFAVLENLGMGTLVVGPLRDEHRPRHIVRMGHRRMHLPDAVGLHPVELELVETTDPAAPVGARLDLDLPAQRGRFQRRQEQTTRRRLQIDLQRQLVTLPDKQARTGQSRTETGSGQQCPLRQLGRADIGILIGERKVDPPDDALLHGLGSRDHARRNPRGVHLHADRKRCLRIEIFGVERLPEILRETHPRLVDMADRADRHPVIPFIAADAQDQQPVLAVAEPLDPQHRGRRVVQPLQIAHCSPRSIDHPELDPVVIGQPKMRRTGGISLVSGIVEMENRLARLRSRRCGMPRVPLAGGQKQANSQNNRKYSLHLALLLLYLYPSVPIPAPCFADRDLSGTAAKVVSRKELWRNKGYGKSPIRKQTPYGV